MIPSPRFLRRAAALCAVALPMAACVVQSPAPQPAGPPPRPVEQYRPAASALPPPPPPPRPVPVERGLTLFTGRAFTGAATRIDRMIPDLAGSGMDNRVSSVSVTSGRWELCARPGFRGRCVTVASSVRDLSHLGLNNQVSSIRRAP